MSRQNPAPRRDRAGEPQQPPGGRPSARTLSHRARERLERRLILGAVGGAGLLVLLVVGFGAFRELVGYPREPVALIGGEPLTLRAFADALTDEMRTLQGQVAMGARDETNPSAVSGQVSRLIESQEKLPEEVLEKQIEVLILRQEASKRGIKISSAEIDGKINEFLSIQRELLNLPTPTPTLTPTPRPTSTPTPEGFEPSPTSTPTATHDPLTPTATLDPLTPTATRTPFPTRPTATRVVTPTLPATFAPADFDKAYQTLRSGLRSEDRYRAGVELELIRERLRQSLGANVPTRGPLARVRRVSTSTKDEATIARLQLTQFDYPFEEVLAQASERPAHGRTSGDLGWVALGAEAKEFDEIVFNPTTALDEWTEPFAAGNHFQIVQVLERNPEGAYDQGNLEKMRDRIFREWLEERKLQADIERDLSAQERQWAIDRASKGIIETTTDRRR